MILPIYSAKISQADPPLEAEIREGMERIAVMEAEAREQDRRLDKLKREMGVD